MVCCLPQSILLKSNKKDKFLRYRKEDDSNHAFLQFSGDQKEENVEIQYVKFEVQKSETMEGYVHIRSCYNNKYWVRKSGEDDIKPWIAVEANEPEEDPSKLSCTLFKPILVASGVDQDGELAENDKSQKIKLVHIDQIGQQGCVTPPDSDILTLKGNVDGDEDEDEVFIVYNAASAFRLPDRVALTNREGKYGALTSTESGTNYYVDFNTSDIGGVGVPIHLSQWPLEQPPRIRCEHKSYGTWMLRWPIGDVVEVRLPGFHGYQIMNMTPLRLSGNNVALQVLNKPGHFVNCGPDRELESILLTEATTISQDAVFGVVEPVFFRAISNVEYDLSDSRVYNISTMDKFRDERRNNTSVEQTGTFSVEYTTSQTTSWNDSVSVTTGISASMSVSIPFVKINFGVELSEEKNQTVEFGKEESESQTVAYQQSVTIPPRKKVTLLVVATRAQCDVPFSCRVVDTLSNGTVQNYTKTDGLFTGSNEFSFVTDILEEDI